MVDPLVLQAFIMRLSKYTGVVVSDPERTISSVLYPRVEPTRCHEERLPRCTLSTRLLADVTVHASVAG